MRTILTTATSLARRASACLLLRPRTTSDRCPPLRACSAFRGAPPVGWHRGRSMQPARCARVRVHSANVPQGPRPREYAARRLKPSGLPLAAAVREQALVVEQAARAEEGPPRA